MEGGPGVPVGPAISDLGVRARVPCHALGPIVVFSSSDGSSWARPPPHCRQRVGAVWDNGPCVCVTEDTGLQGLGGGVSFTTHGAHDLLSIKGGQQLTGCPVACGKSLCFHPEQPGP